MKYTIQKQSRLSDQKASIYVILSEDTNENSLEAFIKENKETFPDEIKNIFQRLHSIGHKTGAREQFFKLNEGKPGDGVCALYDNPDKNLRLYCIRNSNTTVIIGGGGEKGKALHAFQENTKLTDENYFLRNVSNLILERLKDKDIRYSKNGMDLVGDLTFDDTDLQR